MTLYDTLYTYLNTNWAISGETKPVFLNERKDNAFAQNITPDGICGILVQDSKVGKMLIDHSIQHYENPFEIHIRCKTEALRDKYIQECKDLLNLTSTNYIWQITNILLLDHPNWSDAIVVCSEWSEN